MARAQLSDRAKRNRYAHGCGAGAKPRRPGASPPSSWRPGDPTHWQEQSLVQKTRGWMVRLVAVAQFAASAAYLQHRVRHTIGVFPSSREWYWFALQIAFLAYEMFVTLFAVMQLLEHWTLAQRNAIRFDAIPAHLVAPADHGEDDMPAHVSCDVAAFEHYPTVDLIIPCYKEDVRLVRPTIRAAAALDYPASRLNIYLCDDGRDEKKRRMVAALRRAHPNLHYVTRPNNNHAKPGNVNHTLERTSGRLVSQLDADFLARPDMLQTLLAYYYVWNEGAQRYEFNDNVCFVQTPQHYRNMAPEDPDPFDQKNILFYNASLVSKDWMNMATMVGTGNLLNRTALRKAGNFPYHSFGDDTALSLMFHGLGFRSYYVNRGVANGLVPSSLRGNLAQRARWYVTDSQIMFSKHGPLTERGLTPVQRVMYLNMWLHKLQAIMNMFVDVVIVLVLVAGFTVVDVTEPVKFLWYLLPHVLIGSLFRVSLCVGVPGAFKSTAGFEAFETAFKYSTAKGVLKVLFNRRALRWKVAEKVDNGDSSDEPDGEHGHGTAEDSPSTAENTDESANDTPKRRSASSLTEPAVAATAAAAGTEVGAAAAPPADDVLESGGYAVFVLRNLKRCWYNIVMLSVFTFAMTWAIVRPPDFARSDEVVTVDGVEGRYEYSKIIPLSLSFALALGHASAHLLALGLCFVREYVRPYTPADPINGRYDHIKERADGSTYVPNSYVNYVSTFRSVVLLGAVAFLVVMTIREEAKFVPV